MLHNAWSHHGQPPTAIVAYLCLLPSFPQVPTPRAPHKYFDQASDVAGSSHVTVSKRSNNAHSSGDSLDHVRIVT